MRVVAGSVGGLRLQAPTGLRVRPTSERVREAVFSSLASLAALDGATVVDLFAGSGAMGIEALSRGAASATFVDKDPAALDAIRANLATTGLAEAATVVRSDAFPFLLSAPAFDLALVDPPYGYEGWADLLDRMRARVAVLESDGSIELSAAWQVLRCKRYGSTVVTLARAVE